MNRMTLTKEIVVARYKEDVSWLLTLPTTWKITIYNKGPALPVSVASHKHITVIPLENKGREAETIAFHLLSRYNSHADFTVFIQADPFVHAPELMEALSVLEKRETLTDNEKCIPLTIKYSDRLPTPRMINNRQNRFFRVNKMSVNTLEVPGHPTGIINFVYPALIKYIKGYSQDTNPIKTFFNTLNWKNSMPDNTISIPFAYAACFAVTKSGIHQHPLDFYSRLHSISHKTHAMAFILEPLWLYIFNQSFDATKVLPEYALEMIPEPEIYLKPPAKPRMRFFV